MIQLTYPEILAAIRENGLPQITGFFYAFENHGRDDRLQKGMKLIGACAMGQAAINLSNKYDTEITAEELEGRCNYNFVDFVESSNDDKHLTFEQIADTTTERYGNADWFAQKVLID